MAIFGFGGTVSVSEQNPIGSFSVPPGQPVLRFESPCLHCAPNNKGTKGRGHQASIRQGMKPFYAVNSQKILPKLKGGW